MLSLLFLSLLVSESQQYVNPSGHVKAQEHVVAGKPRAIVQRLPESQSCPYCPVVRDQTTRWLTICLGSVPDTPRAVSAVAHGKGPCKHTVHWSAFRGVRYVLRRDSDVLVAT